MQRRLAAILAADVVGYSRLMGTDEIGTITALKSHRRELVDPGIAEHRGRIVKTTVSLSDMAFSFRWAQILQILVSHTKNNREISGPPSGVQFSC
jgi:hypothetical protein